MKTYNHLFDQIISFDNLLIAAKKAKKGKKSTPAIEKFFFRLEKELFQIQKKLSAKTYRPGKYQTFTIHDPKTRMISAAPFRDRVVHHALCNIIEPIFERTFIYDSYANRKGKGTHKAIIRFQQFAKKYPYVLKCDIKKFFPSIDHEILKQEIRWKIKCPDTLWLIDTIIDYSNLQEAHPVYFPGDDLFAPFYRKKGLPIGNLTSQFWANVYMNRFDHYVKESLQVPGYIRYVDDFVLFHSSKAELHYFKEKITEKLQKLRLIPHPNKTHIYQVEKGVPFLGFQVYPYFRYVKKANAHRHFRYLKKRLKEEYTNSPDPDHLEASINSWLGHVRFGMSLRREHRIFWYIYDHGVSLFKHPNGSWRVLEQQSKQLPRNQS